MTEKMRICFLVGSMNISGGTYVIVQHASYLQQLGHEITLAVQEPFSEQTLVWHDEAPRLRCVPFVSAKNEVFDLVIATWWKTALEIGEFQSERYAYFVQSIESKFYPEEESPLRTLVDSTYKLPLIYITEATWIKNYLLDHYGHAATLVRNGIRKDIYNTVGPAKENRPLGRQPRILIEGHFGVRFKNTALAAKLARKSGAKDIWLLTGSEVKWIPGISKIFSRIPMVKTAEIYRSCDILIKLSTVEGMFGPPLEMFHCGGTAVVFNVTGHDEYIQHEKNALVVPIGDLAGVVNSISALINNENLLSRLKNGALQTAADWPSWPESSGEFARWVEKVTSYPATDKNRVDEIVKDSFEKYDSDEKSRIHNNPAITRRYKLSAFSAKFPPSFKRRIKAIEAVGEMVFGGNKAR